MNFSGFWQLSIRGYDRGYHEGYKETRRQVGQRGEYRIGIARVFVEQLIRNELHSMPNSQNSKGGRMESKADLT